MTAQFSKSTLASQIEKAFESSSIDSEVILVGLLEQEKTSKYYQCVARIKLLEKAIKIGVLRVKKN